VTDVPTAAEVAARAGYGRLVAHLAGQWRDVARAEDALGDALLAALETWPRTGIPDRPEAWLLTAARRRLIDEARRAAVAAGAEPALTILRDARAEEDGTFPDRRLALLFVCAHPAVDPGARTPLMLQTVLGLDAGRIASAFLVAPATMSQRLVRAKAKIREAGIAFEIPEHRELPARLDAVLEAIYAAYGTGWDEIAGADPRRRGLTAEAVWLARLVVDLLPGEPEACGLLALMLHCEARRDARRDPDGHYVPLSEQDVRAWSRDTIAEAERVLADAARAGVAGRFQLEAAIQSAHAYRAVSGRTAWDDIALLYEALLRIAPTVGARVGYAAALGEARGVAAALDALAAVDVDRAARYQPYWALRAHLMDRLERRAEADDAYARAIGLCEDDAVRQFLLARRRRGRTSS
jgi:RNA polymerase sigma-70 factor (ECF subfamily)